MLQSLGSFIIPILSGYWFLTHLNYTKYRILRESSYHVVFRSAITGGLLLISSHAILLASEYFFQFNFYESLELSSPIEISVALILTAVLAFAIPISLNSVYSADKATRKAAKRNGDFIELLIDESVNRKIPVHFSLRSGKSYIGYVIESQFAWQDDSDVALIPIASGYRDKDTKKLVITTNYSSIINEVSTEDEDREIYDFRLVIPMSEIVSAGFFDEDVYDRFVYAEYAEFFEDEQVQI